MEDAIAVCGCALVTSSTALLSGPSAVIPSDGSKKR
jgi:hypothetical protein